MEGDDERYLELIAQGHYPSTAALAVGWTRAEHEAFRARRSVDVARAEARVEILIGNSWWRT